MSKKSHDEHDREKVIAPQDSVQDDGPVRVVQSDGRVKIYDGPDAQSHADDPRTNPDRVEFPRPESVDEANQRFADERAERVDAEDQQRGIDREES